MGWREALMGQLRRVAEREAGVFQRAQDAGLHGSARAAASMLGEDLPAGLGELLSWQEDTLRAVQRRICRSDAPDWPDADAAGAFDASRKALETMMPETRAQFGQVLAVMEFAPMALGPVRRRFTMLGPEQQDEHLRGWQRSTMPHRRAVYRALHVVSALGYWSSPEVLAALNGDAS